MSRFFVLSILSLFVVTGCSSLDFLGSDDDKKTLQGERISILELEQALEPDSLLEAEGFVAPEPWNNAAWPQAGGYPNHAMQHVALSREPLTKVWSASIGAGGSKDLPLTAQPIVADGKIFTLDTELKVAAFNAQTGKELWRIFVGNPAEEDLVISGGLAFADGAVFATTGYNEVVALNTNDGSILWRRALNAPARAAPTVLRGRVFVSTLDNTVLALDTASGQILWEYAGMNEATGILGAASPAANNDIVVPAFSSGELYALRVENGSVAWTENLSSVRRVGGLSSLSDIRGLPVIDKGVVIAISFSGKLVAIDERTGARLWQRDIGGSETPWVAGNTVFLISSESMLVALSRNNGSIRWVMQLQRFKNEEDRSGPVFWTGPLLAGGRLIMASSEGDLVEANPDTGELLRHNDVGGKITLPPVIADGTLYLLSNNGNLLAYR